MALPMGGITLFEPTSAGDLLVGENRLRDYAEGQDVEIKLGESSQVFAQCEIPADTDFGSESPPWAPMSAILTNANRTPARVRLVLGTSGEWQLRGLTGTRVKDGEVIVEITVPANARREVGWEVRPAGAV